MTKHPPFTRAILLMTIAFLLAALREWRGSLIAPIVGHALNNFVATTVLIFLLG